MFNHNHYVPILRWKRGERISVRKLTQIQKDSITPLIEFVPPRPPSKNAKNPKPVDQLYKELIAHIPKQILKDWGKDPIFVDFQHLDDSYQLSALQEVIESSRNLGLYLIPVIYLKSNSSFTKAALGANNGLCLRVQRQELNSTLRTAIDHFTKEYELRKEQTDLIFDFGITDDQCSSLTGIDTQSTDLHSWRTFTVASGCFVEDLQDFEPGRNEVNRIDWEAWLKLINALGVDRKPAFGDYTIQYPLYRELAGGGNPTASIRYTLRDKYVIWRGRSLRTFGFPQYIANANLLSKMPEFFGKDFSYGDSYITLISQGLIQGDTSNTGNTTTWLAAGINHHLSVVVDQISSLS